MNYSESFGLTYLKDRSLSYRNHPVGLSNMQSKKYISGANYTRVSIKTHGIIHMYCYGNRLCYPCCYTLFSGTFHEGLKQYFFLG